jgi:hypothetical protein
MLRAGHGLGRSLFKMSKTAMIIVTAVVASAIFGGDDALSMDLNQFQWKNRLLLIFAPEEGNSWFRALQTEVSAQRDEVLDRDLIVFKMLETAPSFMDATEIDPRVVEFLRKQFDAPLGRFTCILVGKDGGVKLRKNERVELKDIFALIDAMPMRQEEMRQKTQ